MLPIVTPEVYKHLFLYSGVNTCFYNVYLYIPVGYVHAIKGEKSISHL